MSQEEINKYFQILERHFMERISLTKDEGQHIRSLFSFRKLLTRQYLLAEGDICRYESYVCEGFLRSFYVDENGNEHTLHFAKEDWWITDLGSFLNQEPASRNIVALEPTILLQIDLPKREQLMKDIPKMERFWRILNEKACVSSDQRILNNISMSGQQRYLALLNKYPDIEQRLPQKHIASFLGMTPVFLSQIRKELAKK
ncbi:Crp/Fnr family transcriptional regulator [Chitinophaga qingshengii]|uniref:Crp/Fnr family transcriptional regulator n=1 Tax=Chitinophaga qingshengii TaxID=1569794 RepID=A0ABR7TKN7_9BACT|nr:Crp/Fnr family transcriptional regulator [Chitinophaga qingshengii]MBC9931024.1 Crp/Fnr family transcriptional regulator [Chitinophaga qingshengii]